LPPIVEYKASVERDLKKIDRKEVIRILRKIEKELAENPNKGQALKGQYKGLYKLRVGGNRVIYTKTKRGVLILRISTRGKAY
jgi:mRNA interferase RelE/StbE